MCLCLNACLSEQEKTWTTFPIPCACDETTIHVRFGTPDLAQREIGSSHSDNLGTPGHAQ